MLFFVIIASILYEGLSILLGLILAIVISSGLEVIVNFLERTGVPRTLGVILIFVAAALIVLILIYTVIPVLLVDLNNIFSGLSKTSQSSWWWPIISFKTTQSIGAVINKLSAQFFSGGASPLGTLSDVLGGLALAVSIVVSSFYLSLTKDGVERFIRAVFPEDYEEYILKIYDKSRRKIGYWFRTQIILSVTMGLMVWAALLILGVKHAFLIAILAAIFELVPFVGPILSGGIAVLSALVTSTTLAIYTLITFLVIQQVEGHLLVPLLTRRSVGLHPVIVIMALLIGGGVGGLIGILISVPLAVVLQEIIEDWGTRKKPRRAAVEA